MRHRRGACTAYLSNRFDLAPCPVLSLGESGQSVFESASFLFRSPGALGCLPVGVQTPTFTRM